MHADHIEFNAGWLLLEDAPPVHRDIGRVLVTGRGVVGLAIPGQEALDSLVEELGLSAKEETMLRDTKRWVTAAGLALCLFSGQAVFNDMIIEADVNNDIHDEKEATEDPKDERTQALDLMKAIAGAETGGSESAAVSALVEWIEKRSYSLRIYNRLDNQNDAAGPKPAIEWAREDLVKFSEETEARFLAIVIPNFPPQNAPAAGVTFKDNANIQLLLPVLAKKIEIPAADDVEGIRTLIRDCVRAEVSYALDAESEGEAAIHGEELDAIKTALTGVGFATSEEGIVWKRYRDRLTLVLQNGHRLDLYGLSYDRGVFDLRLPGSDDVCQFRAAPGTVALLKPYFEAARAAAVPDEPYAIYRKVGTYWKHKVTTRVGPEEVTYISYEVIKTSDESATLKMTVFDAQGEELSSTETEQSLQRPYGPLPQGDVRIEVEAGTFVCIVTEFSEIKTWLSQEYGGLLVKTSGPVLELELVEFRLPGE